VIANAVSATVAEEYDLTVNVPEGRDVDTVVTVRYPMKVPAVELVGVTDTTIISGELVSPEAKVIPGTI
jgi:hypothetical protein